MKMSPCLLRGSGRPFVLYHSSSLNVVLLVLSVAALGGCPSEPSEPGPPPTVLECDIPKMFEVRCGGSICHAAGESTAAALDLTSPGVEDRITGMPGSSCAGTLADPADPSGSLLYQKVAGTPTCGAKMPLNGVALNEDELTCLRDWISGLLPPTSGETDDGGACADCVCEPDAVQDCYTGVAWSLGHGPCVGGEQICGPDGSAWGVCEGQVLPRGEDCFSADIDENCDGLTPECKDRWCLGFGDPASQAIRSAAADSKGNVYSFGEFEGVVSFGGDPLVAEGIKADLVIAKHDNYGNPIWSKRYGDTSNQYATRIIVDSLDNIIVMGRVYGNTDFGGGARNSEGTGDIILAKFDGDGKHIWSRIIGSDDAERADRMVVDSNDDIILTGTFGGKVDFGSGEFTSAGMRDAVVAKLDGDTGTTLFARQIGGTGDDYGFGVDTNATGDIFIAGRFQEEIGFDGDALTSEGDNDIYLAKLSGSGEYQWSASFGGVGQDNVHDLAISPQTGDIVMIGSMSESLDFGGEELASQGLRDLFVVTLDDEGGHEWSANYGDAADQFESISEINSWMTLAIDPEGFIYIGGALVGTLDFGGEAKLTASGDRADAFYVKLDAEGSFVGGAPFGGNNTDEAFDLSLTSTGHILIAGRSLGSMISFGTSGTVMTSSESGAFSTDGFIAKLQND